MQSGLPQIEDFKSLPMEVSPQITTFNNATGI